VVRLPGRLHFGHPLERRRSSKVGQGCPLQSARRDTDSLCDGGEVSLSPGHPIMPMRVIAASEASSILRELYSVDYLFRGVKFDSDLVTVVKDIGDV
jgi:hypothetical protein